MTEIDRRALFTVVGAGAALAACKCEWDDSDAKRWFPRTTFQTEGVGGDFQTEPPVPTATGADRLPWYDVTDTTMTVPTFEPEYAQLIYLKFETDKFTARRASFVVTDKKSTTADNVAVKEWAYFFNNSNKWSGNATELPDGSAKWNFGHQAKIYMYIDNDPSFIRFDEENRIKFTMFSAKKGNPPKSINNSFFNSKINKTLIANKTLLVLENWYRYESGYLISSGGPFDEKDGRGRFYSMNIHLWIKDAQKADVPLIFDPDTNNCGGDP